MFTKNSFAIIYWLQISAAQQMLDFDYLCWRDPSVLAFVNPWQKYSNHKLFYGKREIMIESFPSVREIRWNLIDKADTVVNFASFRSAFNATLECLSVKAFPNIVIVAEGIPERQVRELISINRERKLNIIGPSTVWAMTSGEMRIWNTGWSLDNIVESRLYRKWSVWFVSKSGGMSNEMRRVISYRTNWTHTSVAVWWDRFYVSTFKDIISHYEENDEIDMIVLLWEVWWTEELEIAEMIKNWEITKKVCAFCIWTISDDLTWEVQFWHAGAKANSRLESAVYKNQKLKEAWAAVPDSFMDFWDLIESEFLKMWTVKVWLEEPLYITERVKDINERRPTHFTSSISDERGEELKYNWKLISEFTTEWCFSNVISNLWLKRDLPLYARDFIKLILIILADHWPAVSGATNAIVTARAGNDLKSSLIAWLTTIGPMFWWAIDWAWSHFLEAMNKSQTPSDFVKQMKIDWKRIPWIGHKVKSKFNPDKRCEIMLSFVKNNFPQHRYVDFALEVEALTLEKKPNLILNVDWVIAASLIDIFENIWMDYQEIREYIDSGIFNAFFILARTTGFIGHILDQKRLKEGLYRTPWEDIYYTE